MKTLNAVIKQGADGFYAFINQIDGCVAMEISYSEVKINLDEMVHIILEEDSSLHAKFADGFKLKFEVSLDLVFELLPEVNIR